MRLPTHTLPEGIDDGPTTLPRLAEQAASRFGADIAVIDGGVTLSRVELDALRLKAAAALVAAGIAKGDRIAVWAPNVHEWVAAAMGIQTIGAVLVPLNTRFKAAEAAAIIERCSARMLFTMGEFLGVDYDAALAAERPACLERTVRFRVGADDASGWEAFLATAAGVDPDVVRQMADAVRPDDVMDVMFTSGTTGRPKGALLTHFQNIHGYRRYAEVWGLRRDDVYAIVPPFFHTFGYKMGWLACLITGARMLPVITFDLDQMIPLIEREKVSVLTGPPTVFHGLLAHERRAGHDLSSLRLSMTGAATVPVELVRRMHSDLAFRKVAVAYGMTECNGIGTCTRTGDDPELVANSVGVPVPGVEVRCVDEHGRELPAGQPGEIQIRGAYVTVGFFDDEKAYREAIDADGWLRSGDVGYIGDDGYLRVTDRLKDMYICGGFNCYPAEIEKALAGMPGIAQVVVIGVHDERMGEVGMAYVVPAAGNSLTGPDVIEWSRTRMANYKVPRFVEFVDAFPLNASGKVLKNVLRSRARDTLLGDKESRLNG